MLNDKQVKEQISSLGCLQESDMLDKFFETLRVKEDQACYGFNAVKYVLEQQAAATILISDNLFRSKNITTRRQYVKLAESSR